MARGEKMGLRDITGDFASAAERSCAGGAGAGAGAALLALALAGKLELDAVLAAELRSPTSQLELDAVLAAEPRSPTLALLGVLCADLCPPRCCSSVAWPLPAMAFE